MYGVGVDRIAREDSLLVVVLGDTDAMPETSGTNWLSKGWRQSLER